MQETYEDQVSKMTKTEKELQIAELEKYRTHVGDRGNGKEKVFNNSTHQFMYDTLLGDLKGK